MALFFTNKLDASVKNINGANASELEHRTLHEKLAVRHHSAASAAQSVRILLCSCLDPFDESTDDQLRLSQERVSVSRVGNGDSRATI
jgi:hypothetical protein